MNKIKVEDALAGDYVIIDSRSPGEFEEDHVCGAINIPIFDNCERKEIGTVYKDCKTKAFNLGLEYYSKKMPELVSEIKKIPEGKKVVVYCFRGGMRSKAFTQLVDLLGYEANQMIGGYKAYRNHVIDYFERFNSKNYKPNFIVLWGMTGVGKTRILHSLSPMIDLEGIAKHRSSIFGAVGLKPVGQRFFESQLFSELNKLKSEDNIFIEGEGKRIGDSEIPNNVYAAMKSGVHIKVVSSIESRSKVTVEEYFKEEYIEEIKKIIPTLKQKLSKKVVEEMLAQIDSKDYMPVAKVLLEKYYDPLYDFTFNQLDFKYEVQADDMDSCIEELKSIQKEL